MKRYKPTSQMAPLHKAQELLLSMKGDATVEENNAAVTALLITGRWRGKIQMEKVKQRR
jgi:hypothetical protein